MAIDETKLTKGLLRTLTTLRKYVRATSIRLPIAASRLATSTSSMARLGLESPGAPRARSQCVRPARSPRLRVRRCPVPQRYKGRSHTKGLLADTANVATYFTTRQRPESAANHLDYVFASRGFHEGVRARALSSPEQRGPSDHRRVAIDVDHPGRVATAFSARFAQGILAQCPTMLRLRNGVQRSKVLRDKPAANGRAGLEGLSMTVTGVGVGVVIRSREPRAESREPRAESREPRAESREPRAESREPRAESREPRAESREPRAESREPRAESREPRAESREPRAESREPRAESREPRAEIIPRGRGASASLRRRRGAGAPAGDTAGQIIPRRRGQRAGSSLGPHVCAAPPRPRAVCSARRPARPRSRSSHPSPFPRPPRPTFLRTGL